MLKFGLISFLLVLSIVSITTSAQVQGENVVTCYDYPNPHSKLQKSMNEKLKNEIKPYGMDYFLKKIDSLPEAVVKLMQNNIVTEILMEKVKTNENIEYQNCLHLDAVKIELTNALKQGEEEWNNYWENQEADLSKNGIKQIKEYIQKYIDAKKK